MSDPALGGFPRVEYSLDKWFMDRLPWGAWACVLGLAIVLNVGDGGRGSESAALALVYLVMLGVAFAGWAATTLIERSRFSLWIVLPAIVVVAFLAVLLIELVVGHTRTGPVGRHLWWSQLIDPPVPVFGWMMMYLGCGWIAYILFRHANPSRPVIMLSPIGVSYHRTWLRDVLIPWHEIQAVGRLEVPNPTGPPSVFPKAIAVTVSEDFYARPIAPKPSMLAPPGSEMMFRPNGKSMQMVLSSLDLVVEPDDLRAPIEARWKSLRLQPQPAQSPTGKTDAIVFGRWCFGASRWQWISFLAPLVGLAAVAALTFSLG